MRKKNRRRGKNLLSYMSCNYDQTKLEAPLLTYRYAEYSLGPRHYEALLTAAGHLDVVVAGFKSRRRAHRLAVQLNKYLYAHQLICP